MQLYFTTVVRGAPLAQSGELISLDWDSKKVTARVNIFSTDPPFDDPNPRGGGRGGRGITLLGDRIVAASFHTLHVYDRNLNHLYDICHPQFVGLHEIHSDRPDHIWVTATILDLALELNTTTSQTTGDFWVRDLPGLQKSLDTIPMVVDKTADNRLRFLDPAHLLHPHHLHLNALASWQGKMYALLGSRGAIVNLDKQTVVVSDSDLKPGHNLNITDDGIAVLLGSHSQTVRCYDLTSGELVQVIELSRIKEIQDLIRWPQRIFEIKGRIRRFGRRLNATSQPLFLRGMDRVNQKLFVGANPATIFCFDLENGRLEDFYAYSRDVRSCIHGIMVIPD